uniref:galactose-specific lectin nattectin-like n=1 Tax=Doryrhamphus excisus TaxID=161450 RepID=UPI0025AE2BB5|nr:galactose-specific lectin nattectin-like [Doryrhamphus excisus]XP_057941009.1 galactose-specific lectin nattectin-like [Doryrhamphus excisus]
MASARVFFVLCGISGLLTGTLSDFSINVSAPECPMGWTRLDDRCFIYKSDLLSFAEAEDACNTENANLASLRNNLENALAYQLVRDANGGNIPNTWIGLHDGIEEGKFVWTDGSKVDFTFFRSDQPDDFQGREECVEIHIVEERWNDDGCEDPLGFVCSYDLW